MLAGLSPGVTVEQARSETQALARRLADLYPNTNQGVDGEVLPMWKGHFTSQAAVLAPIVVLACAAVLVLLIVCANMANLLLAHATGRQKEFSARLALGASPARLARQLFTETAILAFGGAVAGVLITTWL